TIRESFSGTSTLEHAQLMAATDSAGAACAAASALASLIESEDDDSVLDSLDSYDPSCSEGSAANWLKNLFVNLLKLTKSILVLPISMIK
ncbi:MAG: hypothetical protein ACKO8R_03725, partial [Candidatus Fonsibacter sp.]